MKKLPTNVLIYGSAVLICLALAGTGDARPPKGGNGGGGNGGGGNGGGGGGGKTSLSISVECPGGGCGLRSDDGGTYYDGVDGVQAFLSAAGDEIVFNTGKRGDPRDVHWDFTGSVQLLNGTWVTSTGQFGDDKHRSVLDIGRNVSVDIRGMATADGDVAVDMWADISISETGRKRDATSIFPRFESDRVSTFGGERCVDESVEGPGIPAGGTTMTGTDVTISCEDDTSGACSEWVIEGTDPAFGDEAVACTYAVYPDSVYRGDYSFGRFVIRATAQ